MVSIGDLAPDFELLNQEEQPRRLSDYRGKKVVIFAFPAADTPGCTAQACAFRDTLPRFDEMQAVILGISPDKPSQLRKFKNGQKLPYDLLSDPQHQVLDAWGAWGVPMLGIIRLRMTSRSYWVLDEGGRVIDMKIGVGPKESVEKALQAVLAQPQKS
jgi:thioredoxin-dependent peroxiredoxin